MILVDYKEFPIGGTSLPPTVAHSLIQGDVTVSL